MADSLNIKNPSIRQGDLDLRTDEQGYITSISGHPIAGGGGGGGTTYYGDNEYIQIKNGTVNTFTVTDKVKNVVDNLTVEIAEQIDAQTYNKNSIDTKLSAKQDELVFAGYEDKIETINGSGFIVNGYVSDIDYQIDKNNFNKKIDYLSASVSGKEDKLTFEYDEDNKVSAINGSALAGQGGTTYSAGAGIAIVDEYISLSADYIQAITQVSGKQDKLEFTYDNSGSIIKINNSAIAGGAGGSVSYTGRNGVEINGNYIELETTAKTAIDSVGGIATDVATLKNASANWNNVSDKLDTTAFSTVSGNFLTAHQSLDDYATKTDISDMATKTWVGQQGFYTKASGDNDYAPKSVTSTINTLTGASAGWNEVTAKLDKSIYSNASGNWEASYNVLTSYSAAGTWLTAHQNLDNYYTKTQVDSTFASATQLNNYLTTAQYQTDSAKYVTSSNVTTQDTDYVMTTTGWKVLTLPGGGMTQVIHDETLTGQGNDNNSKLGVAWSALSGNTINSAKSAGSATSALSAKDALSSRYAKQLQDASKIIEISAITALQNWASSNSSTWDEVSAKLGTAQYANDSATFVTSSFNTITGTKQYALTTTGWSDIELSAYLPLSGGTVSGQLEVHGGSNFDSQFIKLTREGNSCGARIGLGSDTTNGTLALKTFNGQGQNTVQVNIKHNTNNNELIQVQKGGTDVGFLIPAVTATTTAGLTNDGILHIILES